MQRHRNRNKPNLGPALAAALVVSLAAPACTHMTARETAWPSDLPPLQYYEQLYQQDKANQRVQSRDKYLTWVVRFYKGWKLYQDGWQMTTRDIVASAEGETKKQRLENKLDRLGKMISGEWAKNTEDRAIRSRELSIWGQALSESLDRGREEQFVDRVTKDVSALLAGEIEPTRITLNRY